MRFTIFSGLLTYDFLLDVRVHANAHLLLLFTSEDIDTTIDPFGALITIQGTDRVVLGLAVHTSDLLFDPDSSLTRC